MSCNANSNVTFPLIISKNSASGNCDLKCNFTYKYPISDLKVINSGYYYYFKLDDSSEPAVVFNSTKYKATHFKIYTPSLHTYGSGTTDAEMIIYHTSETNKKKLLVCIPLSTRGQNADGIEDLENIFKQICQFAPSCCKEKNKSDLGWGSEKCRTETDTLTSIITNVFSLNKFIPPSGINHPFYYYNVAYSPATDFRGFPSDKEMEKITESKPSCGGMGLSSMDFPPPCSVFNYDKPDNYETLENNLTEEYLAVDNTNMKKRIEILNNLSKKQFDKPIKTYEDFFKLKNNKNSEQFEDLIESATNEFNQKMCNSFDVIAFDLNSSVRISESIKTILQNSLISNREVMSAPPSIPEAIAINNKGAIKINDGTLGDDIYIDCQPTGSDGEELIMKKPIKSTFDMIDFEFYDVLNNTIVQVVLGVLIMYLLWLLSDKLFTKTAFITSGDYNELARKIVTTAKT
jgi:hypothetical protein